MRPVPDQPFSVLLVEDNETDVFVMTEILSECGIGAGLHVVTNGEDALRFLRETVNQGPSSCPHLVILDLNLPKVPGIEVLRQIRSGSRCNRVPVVIVTSSHSPIDRMAVERLGADAYFRKPATLSAYKDLAGVIRRLLPKGGLV